MGFSMREPGGDLGWVPCWCKRGKCLWFFFFHWGDTKNVGGYNKYNYICILIYICTYNDNHILIVIVIIIIIIIMGSDLCAQIMALPTQIIS